MTSLYSLAEYEAKVVRELEERILSLRYSRQTESDDESEDVKLDLLGAVLKRHRETYDRLLTAIEISESVTKEKTMEDPHHERNRLELHQSKASRGRPTIEDVTHEENDSDSLV